MGCKNRIIEIIEGKVPESKPETRHKPMSLIKNIKKMFHNHEVDEITSALQAEDPEWTYKAVKAPENTKGFAYIEIYDENQEFIGFAS